MSRQRMPWYRAYSNLIYDEDYEGLTLEQQGVYHNLRDYANKQTPRGSFQTKNLQALARHVAQGRTDVLQSVLDYCTTEWVGEDRQPHITIIAGRGVFTTFEKWQSPPSAEPDAVKERQTRYKERNNALITSEKRRDNAPVEKEEERDKDTTRSVEETPPTMLSVSVSPGADEPERVLSILDPLVDEPIARTDTTKAGVWKSIQGLKHLDPLEVAIDYVRWQETLPPKKRHKDPVRGWRNQMQMRRGNEYYYRPSPHTPDAALPMVPVDMLERAKRRTALIEANSA